MTGTQLPLVEIAARLLKRDEREAVLGDLLETSEGAWLSLLGVLGLAARRQLQLLRTWRPWAASIGLTLPASLLLMGFSVSISSMFERIATGKILAGQPHEIHEIFIPLLCRGLLLIGGSWACGYVVGSISRRTLSVSLVSCCFPCLFCLARFREPSLSRLSLLLFLLPAICGLLQALRHARISQTLAIPLAISITILAMIPLNSRGAWALNWALIWPAWYIVATATGATGKPGVPAMRDEARRLEQ